MERGALQTITVLQILAKYVRQQIGQTKMHWCFLSQNIHHQQPPALKHGLYGPACWQFFCPS